MQVYGCDELLGQSCMQRPAGGEIDWFNLGTNLVTAVFASYLHFNSTLSSREVDFQALVDLFLTSSIPKRQFGGLFSTEGVVHIHRRKDDCMLSDSCTFSPLLNISCRRSKHEENGKQVSGSSCTGGGDAYS